MTDFVKAVAGLLTAIVAVATLLVSLGVINGQPSSPSSPDARPVQGRALTERMHANDALRRGDALVALNGAVRLTLNPDGGLVISESASGARLWQSNTGGRSGDLAILGDDGNFVLYAGNRPIWATGTDGNPGAVLVLQDDHNLVLYRADGRDIWASDTAL